MQERQSERPDPSQDYTERQREHFAAAIRARARELGIDDHNRTTWLRDRLGELGEHVRWQTVQRWYQGASYPGLRRVRLIGRALNMRESELLLPLDDHDDDPPHWLAWSRTPDGRTMSEEERHILRFFPWPTTPTPGDYRALLAAVRTNAERGQ